MRNMYFKGSNGAIGVYDLTSPESLLRIPGWVSSIKKAVGKIPMILIGNKADLINERRIAKEDAEDLATRLECSHMETSAKEGTNVESMFFNIARICYQNALHMQEHMDHPDESEGLEDESEEFEEPEDQ
jgi:small GTP-binding protein